MLLNNATRTSPVQDIRLTGCAANSLATHQSSRKSKVPFIWPAAVHYHMLDDRTLRCHSRGQHVDCLVCEVQLENLASIIKGVSHGQIVPASSFV
jgi:hypothetical protein